MKFRFSVYLVLSLYLSQAAAMSIRPLSADDPKAKSEIATEEFSPFLPMYVSSYAGAIASLLYFAPNANSPDYAGRFLRRKLCCRSLSIYRRDIYLDLMRSHPGR